MYIKTLELQHTWKNGSKNYNSRAARLLVVGLDWSVVIDQFMLYCMDIHKVEKPEHNFEWSINETKKQLNPLTNCGNYPLTGRSCKKIYNCRRLIIIKLGQLKITLLCHRIKNKRIYLPTYTIIQVEKCFWVL